MRANLVLLFEHQPVHVPPGDLVQDVPRVQDLLVCGAHPRAWRGGDPGGGDRLDGVHVPLAAA